MADREPIFNVPAGVLAILAVLIAVHVTLSLLPEDEYIWWVLALAFIPAALLRASVAVARWRTGDVYVVRDTHGGSRRSHPSCFNALWLLAFGSVLCIAHRSLRFLTFSISGGIAGALLFLALNPGLAAPVIGASGAVSAMMGGVMRFLFNAIDRGEGYLLRQEPGRHSARFSHQRSDGPAHRVLLARVHRHQSLDDVRFRQIRSIGHDRMAGARRRIFIRYSSPFLHSILHCKMVHLIPSKLIDTLQSCGNCISLLSVRRESGRNEEGKAQRSAGRTEARLGNLRATRNVPRNLRFGLTCSRTETESVIIEQILKSKGRSVMTARPQ